MILVSTSVCVPVQVVFIINCHSFALVLLVHFICLILLYVSSDSANKKASESSRDLPPEKINGTPTDKSEEKKLSYVN